MHITGTNYFPSFDAACKYYRGYHLTKEEVQHKIDAGEIHIGLPPCKLTDQVRLIDGRTRYAVVSYD